MFEKCYQDIGLKLSKYQSFVIRAVLGGMTDDTSWYCKCLQSLAKGDSDGAEYGGIYLSCDEDFKQYAKEEGFPDFEGVCFEYDDDFVTMTLEQAEAILQKSMDEIDFSISFPLEYAKFRKEGILISKV